MGLERQDPQGLVRKLGLGVDTSKKAVCPGCHEEMYGLSEGQKCGACQVIELEGKTKEAKKVDLSDQVKSRILSDEYFGSYFQKWGVNGDKRNLDKQVERWIKICSLGNKNIMLELEKMDGWLDSHPPKKNWEQFITNWLG